MKFTCLPCLVAALFSVALSAQNQPPVLSNLAVSADWSGPTLTLTYDLSDGENDPLDISVAISNTNGDTYPFTVPAVGDVGFPVTPGLTKTIVLDLTSIVGVPGPFLVRVVADDKQPFDLQALVNQVDSNRLRDDLAFVEGIRHRTAGLAHLIQVQDTLHDVFAAAGLYSGEQVFTYQGYTGRNLFGTLRGTVAGEQVVIVDAHYDSVNNAPGADDNGSGTVAVMEIARLLGQYPTKKTVRCIGFDLEEAGLVGSLRYVQDGLPANENVLGVFNFEMIGYYSEEPNSQTVPTGFNQLFPTAYNQIANNQFRGDFLINVGNTESVPLGTLLANSAAQYVPALKVISVYPPGNSEIAPDLRRSDHARFWDAGDQALMLTDGANFRNECYHTPHDTLEKLNFTFMANVTRATLAAAAQLAEIQHGDWATASFSNPSGANEPDQACRFSLRAGGQQSGTLFLTMTDCGWSAPTLEIYDAGGRRLTAPLVVNAVDAEQQLTLPSPLPAGLYLAKITHARGSLIRKIVLP